MTVEQLQAICFLPALLLATVAMIDMTIGMYRCERCRKLGRHEDYGYAGMTYCKRCAKKEGY